MGQPIWERLFYMLCTFSTYLNYIKDLAVAYCILNFKAAEMHMNLLKNPTPYCSETNIMVAMKDYIKK